MEERRLVARSRRWTPCVLADLGLPRFTPSIDAAIRACIVRSAVHPPALLPRFAPLIDAAIRACIVRAALHPPALPPPPVRAGEALRRYRDDNAAWFCLHDDCLCCTWAYASEWDLGCHMRAAHDEPAPLPVPADVLGRHLLPCMRTTGQLTRLACVDRASRDVVRSHWDGLDATYNDRLWLERNVSGAYLLVFRTITTVSVYTKRQGTFEWNMRRGLTRILWPSFLQGGRHLGSLSSWVLIT